jgi:hypothetical protein
MGAATGWWARWWPGEPETIAERVSAHLEAGADHVCPYVLDPDPNALPLGPGEPPPQHCPAARQDSAPGHGVGALGSSCSEGFLCDRRDDSPQTDPHRLSSQPRLCRGPGRPTTGVWSVEFESPIQVEVAGR